MPLLSSADRPDIPWAPDAHPWVPLFSVASDEPIHWLNLSTIFTWGSVAKAAFLEQT